MFPENIIIVKNECTSNGLSGSQWLTLRDPDGPVRALLFMTGSGKGGPYIFPHKYLPCHPVFFGFPMEDEGNMIGNMPVLAAQLNLVAIEYTYHIAHCEFSLM